MFLGRVSGTVVSTVQHPFYRGRRMLLVDRLDEALEPDGRYVIAVDAVDAGAGELVLLVDEGNSARQVTGDPSAPVRAVIVGVVDQVYDQAVAQAFGLFQNQVVVSIHSGSRGFGYQVCDDFLKTMVHTMGKMDVSLPDRQLACAYLRSDQGKQYFAAMSCAANYAWANREVLTHWTREIMEQALQISPKDLNMRLLYDVCHNIAKKEVHTVDGVKKKVCVHRKGATRAFPAGHPDVPAVYREVGQPVLIPGDMGRCSYILVGTEKAMEETFGSTCHGAGRLMSRTQAIKQSRGRAIAQEMEQRGVIVMAEGRATLAEEVPEAYKDVSDVVEVVHQAGISRKVARLRPLGVIKG